MANTADKIDGNMVGLYISTNLTTPAWKRIVCERDAGIDGSKDTTTVTTKCGTAKTTGPASWTITGSGIANTNPGTDEVTAEDLITIFQDTADVLIKLEHVSDNTLYTRRGRGQMSAYSETANEGDPVGFDFTIEVSGNLTTTP